MEVVHPSYGKIQTVGFPAQLVKTPLRLIRLAPSLGEHTTQVAADILGYDLDRIIQLRKQRVIR